jgi:hypothetical protein
MNEPATSLFSTLDAGVGTHAKDIASRMRAVVGAKTLTVEQHKALEEIARSELESFVWFFLGCFDNVGCRLPENVLGYRIIAQPCSPSEEGDPRELPEVDIAEGEQDYADMWQDYLADKGHGPA